MNYKLLVVILFFSFLSSCANKQAVKPEEAVYSPPAPPHVSEKLNSQEIPPETEIEEKEEKKAEKPVAQKKAKEQYVMLNFHNADIETVISTISEMLKINYILAPGVTGKITIQSQMKVPFSELFSTFQTILEFNGFTAVKSGSYYRIVPIDTAKQQPLPIDFGKDIVFPEDSSFVTQEVPIEHIKANDVANIVRNLMPRGTDIIVYEPSNMLIVTAPPLGIVKLLRLLEAIDIPAAERDSIRTYVYNVENGEAKKLASILKSIYVKQKKTTTGAKSIKSVTPSTTPRRPTTRTTRLQPAPVKGATVQEGLAAEIEGEVVIEAYEDINALIIQTTPRGYISLLETIKKLDVQPKQVLIEVLVAEITLSDTTKLGLEWLLKGEDVGFDVTGGFSTGQIQLDSTENNLVFTAASAFFPTAYANIVNPDMFNLLISAAASTDRINVLASPHILALDNKEAKIEIADEIPVATSISQPQTTTDNTISQVQFKSAGTILTVTPHINTKNQVTLKIIQEVSELGEKVPIGTGEFQGFTTRKANTTAIVQDGHTLVLGGIITERKQETSSGIPFLSDIPLLGYLFSSTTDTDRRKELILMVTPHVVSSHEEADMLTEEYKNRVKVLKKKIEKRKKLFSD
jgi:type II secretory pathway component GspD/PulD (secretin)